MELAALKLGQVGRVIRAKAATEHLLPELEIAVCYTGLSVLRRLASGNALIKTWTRTRASDWWYKYSVVVLYNMTQPFRIVALVKKTKTSGVDEEGEKALAGPIPSCTGLEWFQTYMELREDNGIPRKSWPLTPAWENGEVVDKSAGLTIDNELYKEVTQIVGEDTFRVTPHSWKTTGIFIAALNGTSSADPSSSAYRKVRHSW